MTIDTLIIGGGISGLYAASLLHAQHRPFLLLEGRSHFGGRIRTELRDGHSFDLGPSWFWPDLNPRLATLVENLGLSHYAQHTKGDALIEDPAGLLRRKSHREIDPRLARRLTGGTRVLVTALLDTLPADHLHPAHRVTSLANQPDQLTITADTPLGEQTIRANHLILALPPRLLANSITFTPGLPRAVHDALQRTPTWMAGDAKFFAIYDDPFWRDDGLSGSAFSETGPLSESHDASLPDGPGALLGFLIPDARQRATLGEVLIPQCLAQLARYFGPRAALPRETILMDWSRDPFTATSSDLPLLAHPSYGLPADAHRLWNNRLHFAGTETAPGHGGYLEGALEAAELAVREIMA